MIANFTSTYCIDTSKIYAAGFSNGGGFTGTLACDASINSKIAAFAPVSGAFYIPSSTCNPTTIAIPCDKGSRAVPVLEFHGDADTTIPYHGGVESGDCVPDIPHWVTSWSSRDGLGVRNKTTAGLYGGKATRYQFPEDPSDPAFGTVTHYRTVGLGHAWPNTEITSYDATPIIMEFFGNHTL